MIGSFSKASWKNNLSHDVAATVSDKEVEAMSKAGYREIAQATVSSRSGTCGSTA
jgi:hypothetical protein